MTHALDDVTPLEWRDATSDDLRTLTDLIEAVEYIDQREVTVSSAEIANILDHASERDDSHLLIGFGGDSAVAMTWLIGQDAEDGSSGPKQFRLLGEVHPGYRHQRIGESMIEWQIDRAREIAISCSDSDPDTDQDALEILSISDDRDERRKTLLTDSGFTPQRWFIDWHCRFDSVDPDNRNTPNHLEGISICPFLPWMADAVRTTHNTAFATEPGVRHIDPEQWLESLSVSTARPEWSWVAMTDDGSMVGYALSSVLDWGTDAAEGWTDRLGVLPDWRGRGIGRALLQASLGSFRRAGLVGGGLGVDFRKEPEGLGLYGSVGYQSRDTIVQFGLRETIAQASERL